MVEVSGSGDSTSQIQSHMSAMAQHCQHLPKGILISTLDNVADPSVQLKYPLVI